MDNLDNFIIDFLSILFSVKTAPSRLICTLFTGHLAWRAHITSHGIDHLYGNRIPQGFYLWLSLYYKIQ